MAITETLLSRSPHRNGLPVALTGVLLLAATSVVFWHADGAIASLLAARPDAVFARGELWRLWTAIGAHADLHHLLSNLPLFTVLAFLLHGYFGAWGFPVLPLALGGLVNALTLLAYPPDATLVGASGVVYLMAGLWLGLFLAIERTQALLSRLAAAAAFVLVLLMPETFDPKTSYLAHAIGFGVGLGAAPLLYLLQRARIRLNERHESPIDVDEAREHESLPGAEPYFWLPETERPALPICARSDCG